MKRIELLAPAKDLQTAIVAINSGCDAVYVGANAFGARQNASNSLEDIKKIVEYAHKFNVKVHVTINTILTDEELYEAEQLINKLYNIGIDAIIVQDMGILKLFIDKKLPSIPIHISTQCDNRLLERVKFFDEIGVTRVILARELSLKQIRKICQSTKCEIETFIHGALCVSYSGQCYMSCSNGGRSANRGECAQSCRKKYSLVEENGNIIAQDRYLLSLKDFNASNYLENLIEIGVKSFKIEGRLKDENYVKNVVAYYRKKLDKISEKTSSGKIFYDFEPDVNKSFNRGFTTYFLDKREKCYNFDTPKSMGERIGNITKIGKNYFEIDTKIIINSQDGLCYLINNELNGCLVNKVENNKIYPNKMDKFLIGTVVYRNCDIKFEKQLTNSKIKRQISVDIVYDNQKLYAKDEDNISVLLELADITVAQNKEKMKENFISQIQKTGNNDFYINKVFIKGEIPFLPVSKINELRRQLLEKLMQERLKNYKNEIQKPLIYKNFPQKILDYKANVHNKNAKEFYKNCNCEIYQLSYEKIKPKNVELMRTKHCLKYAFNMCQSPKKLFLIDDKGKKYKLDFDCKNCEMAIIDIDLKNLKYNTKI